MKQRKHIRTSKKGKRFVAGRAKNRTEIEWYDVRADSIYGNKGTGSICPAGKWREKGCTDFEISDEYGLDATSGPDLTEKESALIEMEFKKELKGLIK
jgi:hypothetical protein